MEKEYIEGECVMRREHEIDPEAWKEWLTETPLEQMREWIEEICSYNGAFDGFEFQLAPGWQTGDWNVTPLYMLDGTHKAGEIFIGKTLNEAVDVFISEELKAINKFRKGE
jgi:hypothetical protein